MVTVSTDKLNVITDRVKKRRDECMSAKEHICAERSRLVTESWKETEGEAVILRRAKLLKKVLDGISMGIHDGELIVGSQTQFIRGASPHIDFSSTPTFEILEAKKAIALGEVLEAVLTDEDRNMLAECAQYWKDRAPSDVMRKRVKEVIGEQLDDYLAERFIAPPAIDLPISGRDLDYQKVIDRGLNGIIAEIRGELDKLDLSVHGSWQKHEFWQAGIICCEAVINFAERYASLAMDMAAREQDPRRKTELEQIAENCKWVPRNPARSFHEALQSFWLIHIACALEVDYHGQTPGRMDQYLYPFYKRDIDEGRITLQQAAELLGCMWVKFNEIDAVQNIRLRAMEQTSMFQDVTIGGVTANGEDATNELTFLLLEVTRQMKMAQPPLYLRYHKGLSDDLLVMAAETARDYAGGNPNFVADAVTIPSLVSKGVKLEDARNYMIIGCLGVGISHASGDSTGAMFNPVKAFELALHNGTEPKTGKLMGLKTGDPRNFKSYHELFEAYQQQLRYLVGIACKVYRIAEQIRSEIHCVPFMSVLLDGCIKNGRDHYKLGGSYEQINPGLSTVGVQNVADSLTAIRKLVFEEKKLTMDELIEALKVDFEGKDDIRQMLLTAPKYGNDDDYADSIFNEVSVTSSRIMSEPLDFLGYHVSVAGGAGGAHWWGGQTVSALPDGKKAYIATADGGVSPVQGMDVKGPTSVILSATKTNHMQYYASALLNMKIMPSMLRTREGINKLLVLIKTFFDRGGWSVQFNMVDRETLLKAQKHPEQYRNLLVRVAGYSAYFVDLAPAVQNEIIFRTEYDLN